MTYDHRLVAKGKRFAVRKAFLGLPLLLAVPVLFAARAQAQTAAAHTNSTAPPKNTTQTRVRSKKNRAAPIAAVSCCQTDSTSAPDPPAPSVDHISETTSTTNPREASELRGMWVVCDSLGSPASVHQIVVTAKKYHLNALFVQVRSRGDAWYNSPYEPRAEHLAGQPADFDPLTQIVDECHASNIQVHAWLNTYLTWSKSRRPLSQKHLWNAHPDWFAHDRNGNLSTANNDDCEGVFLQPSSPDVQQHLFKVFMDVAARYDVDGIHFDYVRYPNSGYDFSSGTLARFREHMKEQLAPEQIAHFDAASRSDSKAYVHAFSSQWESWRRAQVTNLVTQIATEVKLNKPWMQVSAAVFPDGEDARKYRGQDWMGWLRSGTLDAVALMAYDKNTAHVAEQTRKAVAIAGERHVYAGIGAWRLDAHDVAQKVAAVRKAGASGVNLFCYDDVHYRRHYLDTLARGVFSSRSAPPRMRWLPSRGGVIDRSNGAQKGKTEKNEASDTHSESHADASPNHTPDNQKRAEKQKGVH